MISPDDPLDHIVSIGNDTMLYGMDFVFESGRKDGFGSRHEGRDLKSNIHVTDVRGKRITGITGSKDFIYGSVVNLGFEFDG